MDAFSIYISIFFLSQNFHSLEIAGCVGHFFPRARFLNIDSFFVIGTYIIIIIALLNTLQMHYRLYKSKAVEAM